MLPTMEEQQIPGVEGSIEKQVMDGKFEMNRYNNFL